MNLLLRKLLPVIYLSIILIAIYIPITHGLKELLSFELIIDDKPSDNNFTFVLGDDLIEVAHQYCVKNGFINDIKLENEVIFTAMEMLRGDFITLQFHFRIDSSQISKQNLRTMISGYCLSISELSSNIDLIGIRTDELCIRDVLIECWLVYNSVLKQRYPEDSFVEESMKIIKNESIVFVVQIPGGSPTGIGNMLKGFITFLNIHNNTKMDNGDGHILGNYSSILEDENIYHPFPTAEPVSAQQIEYVTTYKFLTLKETADNVDKKYHKEANISYLVDNPHIVSAFSSTLSVDNIFDRSLLPPTIVRNILSVIRHKIHFKPVITDIVNDISDSLIHPSLGISVRSWKGMHETTYGNSVSETMPSESLLSKNFNISIYINLIREVIIKHDIKSVFVSYDSASVEIAFQSFLTELTYENIQVLSYSGNLSGSQSQEVNALQKSAINMLILSNTNVLIGDARSTFVELIYWFGKCRQIVYHPTIVY